MPLPSEVAWVEREDKKTEPGLPPLARGCWEEMPLASRLPFPLVHRRPISTQPLTHLSRMANWAPVYSPQQSNTEGKEGRWGAPTTSGNH
ncbi:hypothetical protein VZT92_018991 [Zoarces viviparus]|uniref:Uncharacterized protein n=1 Tax=Zoarces viviparus TaxID=48416 RepID=A0AAW1EJT1_ZOAVI